MEKVKEAFGQVLRDLDADTIGMYERAKREPLIGTFLQISTGLSVEADYLVRRLQETLRGQK